MRAKTDPKIQKITAHLPTKLLTDARRVTGMGITETLKIGLQKVTLAETYKKLLALKGKHKFSIDLNELRDDGK